jgi:hypothetical protein
MDSLSVASTTSGQAVAIHLLPFSRTFNCSKTTGWFTKGAEIDPNLFHQAKTIDLTPNQMPLLSYLPSSTSLVFTKVSWN